jgi:hypothetical protein
MVAQFFGKWVGRFSVSVQPDRDQARAGQPGFRRLPPSGCELVASSIRHNSDCLAKDLAAQPENQGKIKGLRWWIIGLLMLGSRVNYLARSSLAVAGMAGTCGNAGFILRFGWKAWTKTGAGCPNNSTRASSLTKRPPGQPNFTGAFAGMACQDLAGTASQADFDYFEYGSRNYRENPFVTFGLPAAPRPGADA